MSYVLSKTMNAYFLFSPVFFSHYPAFFLVLILIIPTSYCDAPGYETCKQHFKCGHLEDDLSYPFWAASVQPRFCGLDGFELKCEEGQYPRFASGVPWSLPFRVIKVNLSSYWLTLAMEREDHSKKGICLLSTLVGTPFNYTVQDGLENITIFYKCSPLIIENVSPHNFSCLDNGGEGFYADEDHLKRFNESELTQCALRVEVPVPKDVAHELLEHGASSPALTDFLEEGFNVTYGWYNVKAFRYCSSCAASEGRCATDSKNASNMVCLCPEGPIHSSATCQKSVKRHKTLKAAIGVSTGIGSAAIVCLGFIIYLRRKKRQNAPFSYVSRSISSDPSTGADIEKGSLRFGVHLFSYAELEEATHNFDEKQELGDGGFGTVYYGVLRDGRAVAVKRLYEHNYRRVEQFMNEVSILTRLHHPNLVTLYGCTSRHSRELLLVYEYISNGTVADHVHGEKAKPGSLKWPMRLNIAVETASALAYLHASDTIHRDVKTNNILLDQNFCVKVADFGLSRLFPFDVTHISTAPQGTPGYVDPEYHQCYQLTDKSDVYSFGVVLAELISSLPAVDITRHRHDINLSNMFINKIPSDALHELVDPSLGFDSDYSVRKMVSAVAELAFRCLQGEKELRPNMEEVLETLKEIQAGEYNLDQEADMDTPSDDIGLLKHGLMPPSPVSVTAKWNSISSTLNASS